MTPPVTSGFVPFGAAAAAAVAAVLATGLAHAETSQPEIDRFTATTASMTPENITLRIDVREWSDEEARSAVVDALSADSEAAAALKALPTLGYVWRSDSGVGYSVKYADRRAAADGERLTFVTDRSLGEYDFEPWSVEAGAAQPELDYSVIELYLDGQGSGDGTLSIAAEAVLDPESGTVSLRADADTPRVLTDARAEPLPYWAEGPSATQKEADAATGAPDSGENPR